MNELGLRILKSFESCKLKAYRDPVGIVTIGWGQTGPDIVDGLTWTQEQADDALAAHLAAFEADVRRLVTVELNSNQLSALIDFAYNVGTKNLEKSNLLRRVNLGEYDSIPGEFAKWHFAAGRSLAGLVGRRRAEACLFAGLDGEVKSILAQRA